MKKYNLYYKNSKVNRSPLSLQEVQLVYSNKAINKKDNNTGELKKIYTSDLKCVNVTII